MKEQFSDMSVIDSVNGCDDLKSLGMDELKRLAGEIRRLILEVVSSNGGHLASSLGAVELAIALNYVYSPPRDKIIWDVGHQAYAHKIINGRRDAFRTLRRRGGISGFPNPSESDCDAFVAGHASTSISAALGFAAARKLTKEKFSIAAVIGDGSMTGGMAFEALNNASSVCDDLTVVLNDNNMSISRSVGAFASYLSNIRLNSGFIKIRSDLRAFVRSIPGIGKAMLEKAEKLEDHLTYFLCPGVLFEAMGFSYLGPFNGHDIPLLISVLEKSRRIEGNKLIHVRTVKGKGYGFAERNPSLFHGTGPFDIETGKAIHAPSSTPTYTGYFGRYLSELAAKDKRIVAVTAAMKDGTGLGEFARRFPKRFFDVGIAEQHAVTFAAAMAMEGLRPFVAVYSTFLQRAFDQIIHDVALQNLPVVFCIDRAGIAGEDGATHQGAFDVSYLRLVPNMTILAPGDELEMKAMMRLLLSHDGPAAIRFPKRVAVGLPESSPAPVVRIGESEIVCDGKDLAIIAVGSMVFPAMIAVKTLSGVGISAMLINARTLKPLDSELIIKAAEKFRRIVTVEENALSGGFGSAVAELLSSHGLSASLTMLGLPDRFIPHAHQEEILDACGLTPQGIVRAVVGR